MPPPVARVQENAIARRVVRVRGPQVGNLVFVNRRKEQRAMKGIYLPANASKARVRAAENGRRNRAEIVRELSWGRVSRRDLIKMGIFTGAGLLAPIGGLNPFVSSVFADGGSPRSPLFGCQPFTQ